jgi:putative transposase
MRNLMAVAHHDQRQVIGALIRTIFAQPDRDRATTQLRQVVDQLAGIAPTVAEGLQAMETDLLAYTGFPPGLDPPLVAG